MAFVFHAALYPVTLIVRLVDSAYLRYRKIRTLLGEGTSP